MRILWTLNHHKRTCCTRVTPQARDAKISRPKRKNIPKRRNIAASENVEVAVTAAKGNAIHAIMTHENHMVESVTCATIVEEVHVQAIWSELETTVEAAKSVKRCYVITNEAAVMSVMTLLTEI